MKPMRSVNLYIILSFFFSIALKAQTNWEVPKDKQDKVAPFKFNDESQKKGATIFQQNCISCHGTPGKNNFVKLSPPPNDPASEQFAKQTDGSLFYKITQGRGAMPSFKDILTEEQRWQVISYIRSFHKNYIQPEPQSATVGTFGGLQVDVEFSYDSIKKQFKARAIGKKDSVFVKPIEGLELSLYAKRYFGRLLVDEPKTTNKDGEAFFAYTDSLPGDKKGNIDFLIKINTEGLSDFQKTQAFKTGKILRAKALNDTRAMWTNSSRTPWWLLFSYLIVVSTVWAFIVYIAFQIVKIWKIGRKMS
jgi:mono/diheme cytochrome c family protein